MSTTSSTAPSTTSTVPSKSPDPTAAVEALASLNAALGLDSPDLRAINTTLLRLSTQMATHHAEMMQAMREQTAAIQSVGVSMGRMGDEVREELGEKLRREVSRLGEVGKEIEQREVTRRTNSVWTVDHDSAPIQWPSPLRPPQKEDYPPILPSTIGALKRMSESDLLGLASAHTPILKKSWLEYAERGGDLQRELPRRIASSIGFRIPEW